MSVFLKEKFYGDIMINKPIFLSIVSTIALVFNAQGCDVVKKTERSLDHRLISYAKISNRLACLSDMQLEELLKTATVLSVGYGENVTLHVNGIPVFIKKIPLTDLERKPENRRSTANIFNLPMFYQYGIGSAGFGVWRELAANVICTNWVLTGQCENFPIMYHWRVLPGHMPKVDEAASLEELNEDIVYWDSSPDVAVRLKALQNTSAFVVIFLESIPQRLSTWLDDQFKKGISAVDKAIVMIEKNIEKTTSFMREHGMYHFDAHFNNILTDGYRLYFADMGLAASASFNLSAEEIAFFQRHKWYDTFYTRAGLAGEVAQRLATSRDEFKKILKEYGEGKQDFIMSPTVTSLLKRYAPYATVRDAWVGPLLEAKSTPYPAREIEALCVRTSSKKRK